MGTRGGDLPSGQCKLNLEDGYYGIVRKGHADYLNQTCAQFSSGVAVQRQLYHLWTRGRVAPYSGGTRMHMLVRNPVRYRRCRNRS